MMSRYFFAFAAGAALLASATVASAQPSRPERPYRGLFASGGEDAGQTLTANASLSSGYDDNLLADATGGLRGGSAIRGTQSRGVLGQLSGSLTYSLQRDGLTVGASASSNGRYYPSLDNKFVHSIDGRVTISARPRTATNLSAHAGVVQQPDSFSRLFATASEGVLDEAPLPDLDTTSTLGYYTAYDGSIGIDHNLTRRTKIGGSYGFRKTDGRRNQGEFNQQRGSTQLSYQLGRGLSLRAGYSYIEAHYSDGHAVPNQVIDAGVNYNRSLSFSRRTTLSFGTGTAATRAHDKFRYNVIGDLRLNHEIGRSWLAYAAYSRRVMLYESWEEPVLADSITAGYGGLIGRRLQVTTTARAALGTVGEDTGGNKFDAYHGSATLTFALNRFSNVGATYSYYRYRAGEGVLLPEGYPRSFDRQSIRATFNLWAPLFQSGRRTNVTR